jgi:hypothetical protein
MHITRNINNVLSIIYYGLYVLHVSKADYPGKHRTKLTFV